MLACALAPAYTVGWHIGFYPNLLEIGILLTVVVFAWESYQQRRMPILLGRETFGARTFLVATALLVIAGALSVIVAPDRRAALGLFRAYFIEPVLFFVVLINAVRTSRQAFMVVAGLGLGGIVVALLNIVTVLDALRHHAVDTGQNTPVAVYQTSNAVALFLVPIIAVAGSVLLHSRSNRQRQLAGIFIAIAGSAVVLSFSRGGYLASVAVAIGLALSHRRRWWLLGGLGVVVAAAIRVPIIASRLGHEFSATDPSNTLAGRIHLWQATLSMMRGHLLFGTGLSGYAHFMSPWPAGLVQLIYPHNLILNFWVATGVLGVLAFVVLLIQGFRIAWRGWIRGDVDWRPFELGVLLALVAVVVHGLVDVPYFKNDLSFEFWVLLAIAWAGIIASRSRDRPAR
ncbi:MAG TPA: O-antigen ligase family protein [Candidatus Dormibacteraeota bacterium]|nr:O-antigen ligase family protein [Candidatus Dormibacteraeota bacterium]